MTAAVCLTNADSVKHADSEITGGKDGSTAGIGFCQTHGGACQNRSLPLRVCGVRAYLEAARAPLRAAVGPSVVTGSGVSR